MLPSRDRIGSNELVRRYIDKNKQINCCINQGKRRDNMHRMMLTMMIEQIQAGYYYVRMNHHSEKKLEIA
jgi:hypothetical protein